MGKHSIQIDDDKLFEDIVAYCKINNLKIGAFVTEILRKQFMLEQYGDIPFGDFEEVKPVLTPDYKQPEPILPVLPMNYEEPIAIDTNKTVDNDFYSNITKETVEEAVKETQKQTSKPKKRRL